MDIAFEYGNPIYVYDSAKIALQYHRLTSAFSSINDLRINYATKALSNVSILKLIRQFGCGLDTVSIQEVQLGLTAGLNHKPSCIPLMEFPLKKSRTLPKWVFKST